MLDSVIAVTPSAHHPGTGLYNSAACSSRDVGRAANRHKLLSVRGPFQMVEPNRIVFDAGDFLAKAGLGRRIVELSAGEAFFSQGHHADSIFYLQRGRAKLTVVSGNGKEATISLLSVGEESLASVGGRRMATATAINGMYSVKD